MLKLRTSYYGNSSLVHIKSSIFEMQLQNYFGSAVSLLVGCPPGPSSAQPRLYTTLAVYIGNGQKLLLFPEKYIQGITFSSVCSGNVIALKFLMVFFFLLFQILWKIASFETPKHFSLTCVLTKISIWFLGGLISESFSILKRLCHIIILTIST